MATRLVACWNEVETNSIPHVTLAARPPSPAASRDLAGRAGLAYRWRQLRLGVAFALFGMTSLAVAFVIAPVVRRLASSPEAGELAVQRSISRAYALSVGLWKLLGILTLDAPGISQLAAEGPCVVVSNHPTLTDVVLVGSFLPQMDCIVNAGWTAHSPFLARAIDMAGYVRNDGGRAVVDECASRLARGRRLLVFPEGTRSPWGSFGKFHRGAAHISLASGAPIVALAIRCRPRMLGSGRKWSEISNRRSDYEITVAGRLEPAAYDGMTAPLAARKMTDDLLRIYLEEPHLADA